MFIETATVMGRGSGGVKHFKVDSLLVSSSGAKNIVDVRVYKHLAALRPVLWSLMITPTQNYSHHYQEFVRALNLLDFSTIIASTTPGSIESPETKGP